MPDKILIVDDDIDSLKLIALMLQRHGYDVVIANTGNQALAKAHNDQPHLIILDVMMPDMNGYEVCRRLRANPDTQSIPIIMFTAKTLIDDKVAGFEAGADDYLTKPTHPAELASRVRAIIQRNRGQESSETRSGHGIGVIGAKGGVGATTIALNLAAAFQQMGGKAIVCDFRLGMSSLGMMIGVDGTSGGMGSVLSQPIEDIHIESLQKQFVTHQSGLRILASSGRPKESSQSFTSEAAHTIINNLRGMGDPIIFDLGTGLNMMNRRLLAEMHDIVLLVEPSKIGFMMAKEMIEEITRVNRSPMHVVIVYHHQPEVPPQWQDMEQAIGHDIKAILAGEPALLDTAIEAGTPFVLLDENALLSTQIIKLAQDIYDIR